jgi:hypothetical protein
MGRFTILSLNKFREVRKIMFIKFSIKRASPIDRFKRQIMINQLSLWNLS